MRTMKKQQIINRLKSRIVVLESKLMLYPVVLDEKVLPWVTKTTQNAIERTREALAYVETKEITWSKLKAKFKISSQM